MAKPSLTDIYHHLTEIISQLAQHSENDARLEARIELLEAQIRALVVEYQK